LENGGTVAGSVAKRGKKRKKSIFIVYASHEEALAENLEELFKYWGFDAFFCRSEIRDDSTSRGYRDFLRQRLLKADLAILLLSREFQWSPYCQAEAGVTETKNLPKINVLIPPANESQIKEISPVIEGHQLLVANDPAQCGRHDGGHFLTLLERKIRLALKTPRSPQQTADVNNERTAVRKVEASLTKVIENYRLSPPDKEVLGIWHSIANTGAGQPARISIVESILKSLKDRKRSTDLVFVGVSLKYSLVLITQALAKLQLEFAGRKIKGPDKSLNIQLVHMDDHAHILHELADNDDIRNIRDNFYEDWPTTLATWEANCNVANVKLTPPKIIRIDYIPPRIGILIDGKKFYAGRCSFEKVGVTYRLMVGERDYFHYTPATSRGSKSIREFQDALEAYGEPNHNGVVALSDSEEWIEHLCDCVKSYHMCPGINEIVLISQSAMKFRPLINLAIQMHIPVNIYVQDPASAPENIKHDIEGLRERIEEDARNKGDVGDKWLARVFYYQYVPTFRAAVIGTTALGVQIYKNNRTSPGQRALVSGPLAIIATQYTSQFKNLRDDLILPFLKTPEVGLNPAITLPGTP
jgi:hypothetical protein